MRYDFGRVYKEIRESKGLTQEDVCGDILSRTSLSKVVTIIVFYFDIQLNLFTHTGIDF